MSKITVSTLKEKKQNKDHITMLTAYDYTTAKLLEEAGIETILVGDSLGMTILGYEDTLSVTMEDMIHHTKAVKRGVKEAMVICDMPFLSYHISVEEAVRNAGRIIKETGAQGVKMEGGFHVKDKIEGVLKAQIPVMGHLGLTPQSVHALGGFKVQGKSQEQAQKLMDEAKMLEQIGCFAIVLECVPASLAEYISKNISIPTIGIGAGKGCDGQVLVIQDMLGFSEEWKPKFVKQYAQMGKGIKEAVSSYCKEVKEGTFPEKEHTFHIEETVISKLY